MLRDDPLVLVPGIDRPGQKLIIIERQAADHVRALNIPALKGQQHLIPDLRQEIVAPLLAARRHRDTRPLQLVRRIVTGGDRHAHAPAHIRMVILRHNPHHHADNPGISRFRLCDLAIVDFLYNIV